MKICIASAHAQCDKQMLWRRLQNLFITKNTKCDFEYHIVANGIDPSIFKFATSVVGIKDRVAHIDCINEIQKIFNKSNADYFCLLDSDCWPIRDDWTDLVSGWADTYSIVAPIRPENLDVFPHPCAAFFRRDVTVNFRFIKSTNLLGDDVNDISCDKCSFYPLLKTNYISPHPVYASIYGDIFYHHCAGSRALETRSANYYRYLIDVNSQKKIYTRVTSRLRDNPEEFINMLRGLNFEW